MRTCLGSRVLAALYALASAACGCAAADPVADFYKGKTITILVPIGPGGTYDLYGRLGAAILEKHMPGKPTVVTQLMTGGGGAVSTNYLANRSPRDGTALISLHGSAPQNQVLGVTGVSYDLAQFLMIGQFAPLNSSLTVWRATSPGVSIEDAKKQEIVLGSTGAGSYQYQLPILLNVLIGTKFKVVLGYRGIPEENLAMERGEIHGRGGTLVSWAVTEEHWVKENRIAHLVQVGSRRAPGFETVPLATELVSDPSHKQALDLISAGSLMGLLAGRLSGNTCRSRQGPACRVRRRYQGPRNSRQGQGVEARPGTCLGYRPGDGREAHSRHAKAGHRPHPESAADRACAEIDL